MKNVDEQNINKPTVAAAPRPEETKPELTDGEIESVAGGTMYSPKAYQPPVIDPK